ncbi:hypothetical protein N7504_007585 [Penicillium tannophilum]|nr:hypothetical protein N7504_007585 [Penicillium tannophilum]
MSIPLDTLITRSDQHPLSTCLDELKTVRVFPPPDDPPNLLCHQTSLLKSHSSPSILRLRTKCLGSSLGNPQS